MPPDVPSPHRLPMPLDDYLQGRGNESPPLEMERHSTLPNEAIRGRLRKEFELRPSKSDPNLGDHVSRIQLYNTFLHRLSVVRILLATIPLVDYNRSGFREEVRAA